MSKMDVNISWRVWQNMHKKTKDQHDIVMRNNEIVCPGYHDKYHCSIDTNNKLVKNPENKFGNAVIDKIQNGDYIIIPESNNKVEFLLVQVIGDAVFKIINNICKYKNITGEIIEISLHLFSFKTPTLWAVMSGEGVAYCASSMRNGVKDRPCKKDWDTAEIMTAYVRPVKIIKKLHVSDYPIIINKYIGSKTRGSIVRNKDNDIIQI